MYVKLLSRVRLCNPMDGSLPGSMVHGISQARKLEWAVISFSRGSSQPRIKPRSPALQTDALLSEPLGKPTILLQLQKKCLYVPVPLFLKLTSLRGHSGCWAPLAPVTAALEARGGEVQPAQDRRDQQHCPAVITNYSGLQVAHPSSASLSVTWLPLKGKETPGRGQPCPCRQPTFT